MNNKDNIILGDVLLFDTPENTYTAVCEINGTNFMTRSHNILYCLNFILDHLTKYRNGDKIKVKGNSKHDKYMLDTGYAEDGSYVIEATAKKSKFYLCFKSKDDCKKVLEAIDLRFPRNTLREFIGEAAREALRSFEADSF